MHDTLPQPNTMPGLRGLEHVGFTVPDLQQATDFFCNVLGCEPVYEGGMLQRDDNWLADNLNVHPRTVLRGLRFLRCPNGTYFELFDYQPPEPRNPQPRNSDIGGHHLAFYVDDCQAATTYLLAHGVQVLGEPKASRSGPSAGQTWVYFLTPWGMQCELVSYPQGKACDLQSGRANPFSG